MTQRFEYTKGGSNKFWETKMGPTLKDGTVILYVRWGRIGTRGQVIEHHYPSAAHALVERNKMIQGKLAKGYEHINPHSYVATVNTLPEKFEFKEYFDFEIK